MATYVGFEPTDIYSDSVATTPSSLIGQVPAYFILGQLTCDSAIARTP